MNFGKFLDDHMVQATGEPRLARELCPKKPRANQNRTNQGSILLYTHQN